MPSLHSLHLSISVGSALLVSALTCCTSSPPAVSNSQPALSPIEIARHLESIAPHRPGNSGDYNIKWSFLLAHPAPFPLVVAQRYESKSAIQDDTDNVIGNAAYTEILGFIPTGRRRPVIMGSSAAVRLLLDYAEAHPSTPMQLPTREQLKDFTESQLAADGKLERPALARLYDAALRALRSDDLGVCDHWYFTGSQLPTQGSATIIGRVVLYRATRELLVELSNWEPDAASEHLRDGTVDLSSDEFDKLFKTSPPAPGMGGGGSGAFLSCNDEAGKPPPLSNFKEISRELAPGRLMVTWKKTDQPDVQVVSPAQP